MKQLFFGTHLPNLEGKHLLILDMSEASNSLRCWLSFTLIN